MKRWEHLTLTWPDYLTVVTIDQKTIDRTIAKVEEYVGEKIDVSKSHQYRYKLKKLRNRDYEVFMWLIGWLCVDGWEPYAVHSDVLAGEYTKTGTTHHFRREIPDTAA
jgi:hypothetical protein